MSVRFRSITVVPHFQPQPIGGFDLYWQIEGNDFTPTFQILQADTESGPTWTELLLAGDPLVATPTADLFALNVSTQIINMQALRWFKVQVFNGSTLVLTSWPVDHRNRLNRPDYLFYREHLRRARLTLEKKTGCPGLLLRRKIYGSVCTDCCDEIHLTPASQECSVCYGTGIIGGYYPPVAMKCDWGREGPPRNANTAEDPGGPMQIVKSQATAFPVPDIKSEDVWVDTGTGYRFNVERNDITPFRGSVMWQVLTLSRLPAHHPAYRFPLS